MRDARRRRRCSGVSCLCCSHVGGSRLASIRLFVIEIVIGVSLDLLDEPLYGFRRRSEQNEDEPFALEIVYISATEGIEHALQFVLVVRRHDEWFARVQHVPAASQISTVGRVVPPPSIAASRAEVAAPGGDRRVREAVHVFVRDRVFVGVENENELGTIERRLEVIGPIERRKPDVLPVI